MGGGGGAFSRGIKGKKYRTRDPGVNGLKSRAKAVHRNVAAPGKNGFGNGSKMDRTGRKDGNENRGCTPVNCSHCWNRVKRGWRCARRLTRNFSGLVKIDGANRRRGLVNGSRKINW